MNSWRHSDLGHVSHKGLIRLKAVYWFVQTECSEGQSQYSVVESCSLLIKTNSMTVQCLKTVKSVRDIDFKQNDFNHSIKARNILHLVSEDSLHMQWRIIFRV